MPEVDPSFLALPFRSLGEIALARAADLGATHADFRFERIRSQRILVRDGALQELATAPYGKWLLGIVAAGLFAYGVFCLIQARYREV